MSFELTVLGSNAAVPAHGRHMSAQFLRYKDHCFLIDCAEATQMRLQLFKLSPSKIKHIFISHLHGDHIFGLPGLLMSMSLNKRIEKLTIYSPQGLKELLDTVFRISTSQLSFQIEYFETNPEIVQTIFETDSLVISTIPLKHRIPSHGFLFKEKLGPRKIIREKIKEYGIPYNLIDSIKNGQDWTDNNGNVVANSEITEDPVSPKSYAYCSDTAYFEAIIPIIKNVDLLYHEATFSHDLIEQAELSGHTTAKQAAMIAKAAEAKKLLLGHFSTRYTNLNVLLEEAKDIFQQTELAVEGKLVSIG
jgi:ribonuclease Z